MEVRDPSLGGYDGMLFVFDQDEQVGFWMRNTPMPLSIAYFDGDGRFVSASDMAPCADSPAAPPTRRPAPTGTPSRSPEVASVGWASGRARCCARVTPAPRPDRGSRRVRPPVADPSFSTQELPLEGRYCVEIAS